MKSTHRTQGGHDKNLYSCETQPSVRSIGLFICLFDSPRRSAGGTAGPTKVRCQCGVCKIEQSRMRYGERPEKTGVRERLGAGSVGGWVGGFGNTERTPCVLLLVKQSYEFCNGFTHSASSIGCKNLALRGQCL